MIAIPDVCGLGAVLLQRPLDLDVNNTTYDGAGNVNRNSFFKPCSPRH